jgi:hypothetical protein
MKIYFPAFVAENHSIVAIDADTFKTILHKSNIKSDYITDDLKLFLFDFNGDNWISAKKCFQSFEYKVCVELTEPPKGFTFKKCLWYHSDVIWYLTLPEKRRNLTFGMTFNQLSQCKQVFAKIQQLLSNPDYESKELLSEIDSIVDCLDVPFE